MAYSPEAGDLIWTDFDPRIGREQSGRRPALVVSPADFCRATEFAIVCPITVELTELDVGADRNLAYSHSIQRVAGTDRQGKKLDLTVRVTDVYKKARGRWVLIHEHVSVPVDLGTGKPDLSSKP